VKSLSAFLIITLSICCPALSVRADEVITCKSPDGKFALRCVYADKQPYNGSASIVEMPARKTVLVLDPNWTLGNVKLLWSPDSLRVAYFFEKGNNYATRVFFRHGPSFSEIALPYLPVPKLPPNAMAGPETETWIEPMSWSASHDLLLEKELLNPAWGRAALKITLGFDEVSRPFVRTAAQEKMSIVDYFLLLPAENFEAPLSAWLRQMRIGGFFQMCDGKWREKHIDERNGYMSCDGDGAQPEFEVALFRYRDGRPLLALCSGELEGPDSVSLGFFELGADGKMHEIKRSIFPVPDSTEDRWQFELPREGKTILVRAIKSKKILHRIVWNGEKFEEQK
jgi:hypothetical protein